MTWPDDYINKVICGDCLRLLRDIPDNSISAVITDPPYSSGGLMRCDRNMNTRNKYVLNPTAKHIDFYGDNRDQRSMLSWATLWGGECFRILMEGSPFLMFSDWRQLPIMSDALQASGFIWRGIIVWDKISCRPTMGRFASQCEYVVWGSKGPMPQDENVGCLPGVIREMVRPSDKHHITGKPTQLMRDLVRICPSGIVLDPFAGSGTTLVAAKNTGHEYVGFDMSPDYCKIAEDRLRQEELFPDGVA